MLSCECCLEVDLLFVEFKQSFHVLAYHILPCECFSLGAALDLKVDVIIAI